MYNRHHPTGTGDRITFAYGLHPKQIAGGPAWMESDHYHVTAKPEGEGQPSDAQWKAMVQKLLADRFQLRFHHEKKELSAYAIVKAKDGAKLTKSEGDPPDLYTAIQQQTGLKIESTKAMVDMLVIDHVEKPPAN